MVVLGESSSETSFSYIEYRVLMLSLAGTICFSLMLVEVAVNKFQVLPLLFPGMFTVRERRFYFFNFDISDGVQGKRIRGESKLLVRMTLCVVFSYLWQHCVLSTHQQVGWEFPTTQCNEGSDCFASELQFWTLFNRQHTAIDCKGKHESFSTRVVVSCIHVVKPTATNWLMHLAIGHSITQLNFKLYEVFVWVAGNSVRVRQFVGLLICVALTIVITLFFSGVSSEFVSSWLGFVMSLSMPVFLYCVWKNAKALETLWKDDAQLVQVSIEQHLSAAFSDIEAVVAQESMTGSHAMKPDVPSAVEMQMRGPKNRPNWITQSVDIMAAAMGRKSWLKARRARGATIPEQM